MPEMPARDALLARLEADGALVRDGPAAHAPGGGTQRAAATPQGEAALQALAAAGWDAPGAGAIGADAALVAALEREGALVRLAGGDVLLDAAHFERAREAVVAACERDGEITLAALRDALGASRRVAQAVLERLDGDGVTRRVGDRRVLRRRGRGAAKPL